MTPTTTPARRAAAAPPATLDSLRETMGRLDQIVASTGTALGDVASSFTQAITMAAGITDLRNALTDEIMERVFLPLMNSKLGFRTDRDPSRGGRDTYSVEVVKECLIEATLRGLPPVGNCWNIISGQSYVTKEGFWFLLGKRVEGLTDFKILVGVPKMIKAPGDARNASDEEAKGAVVSCSASWKLNGAADRLERDIPIRVNALMGADAIMGKAERKVLAAAYAQITGTALSEADAAEADADPGMRDAKARRPAASAPTGAGFEVEEEPAAPVKHDDTAERQALTRILGKLTEANVSTQSFEGACRKAGVIPSGPGMLHTMPLDVLETIEAKLPELLATFTAKGGAQ